MNPLLELLHKTGGRATSDEMEKGVESLININSDLAAQIHEPERGDQTELAYRLAWARTYLAN